MKTVYVTEYNSRINAFFIDTKKKIRKPGIARYRSVCPDEEYTMKISDELYNALKTGTAVVLYDEVSKPTTKSIRLGDSGHWWLTPCPKPWHEFVGANNRGIAIARFGEEINP